MPMLPKVFTTADHEPMTDFTPIPDDWYLFEIVKSEIKDTKAKNGKRLNFQLKVIEGGESKEDGRAKHVGRLVFVGLNIQNPSAQAVEISMRELRSLCDACNVEELEDSVELHDIPFWGKTGIEESEGYAPKNFIKKYMSESEYEEAFVSKFEESI